MRPALFLVAVLALPAGCLGPGDLVWTVTVEPFGSGRWSVNVPVPVGAADARDLVAALRTVSGSADIRLGQTTDGQYFVQLSAPGLREFSATLPAAAENVTWSPLVDGAPAGRVNSGPEVRIVDAWRLDASGCRGEAVAHLGPPGNTTTFRPTADPCG